MIPTYLHLPKRTKACEEVHFIMCLGMSMFQDIRGMNPNPGCMLRIIRY